MTWNRFLYESCSYSCSQEQWANRGTSSYVAAASDSLHMEHRGRGEAAQQRPPAPEERRFRFSLPRQLRWDAGGMFEAGSSGRPRCWDNVHKRRVLIAPALEHISITCCWAILNTDCAARLSLSLSVFSLCCVRRKPTRKRFGWQLFPRSSQWRSAFVCCCSQFSPAESRRRAKTTQPRRCRWRCWWVGHTCCNVTQTRCSNSSCNTLTE